MQTRSRIAQFTLLLSLTAPTSLAQPAEPAQPANPAAPALRAPNPGPAPAPEVDTQEPAVEPGPAAVPEEPGQTEPGPEDLEPSQQAPISTEPAPPVSVPVEPLPSWREPGDAARAGPSGAQRTAQPRTHETDVFAEDWWSHARPILEFHGYLRLRAELFYRFSLGRIEPPRGSLGNPGITWPRPADAPYTYPGARLQPELCTQDEAGSGSSDSTSELVRCSGNTQAGANLRFRLNPEIHVSDNLRVVSQIDILDNLVLGSTSSGYSVTPGANGYTVGARRAGSLGYSDETLVPPRSGINSLSDSIQVKRAWAEYSTPVGELRFGRMPNHWGLGVVNHSGDGYDDDSQSTIDRIQFIGGIKPLELYLSGAWDFPNEGPTSDNLSIPRAQPYDIGQKDDVTQYVFSVARRKSAELQRLALARGDLVVNGGVQLTYRSQLLSANDSLAGLGAPCDANGGSAPLGCNPGDLGNSYTRRDAYSWQPDLWVQVLYKKFRFELEATTSQGSIGNITTDPNPSAALSGEYNIRQWGFATELEQWLAEDRLMLGLGFGWGSGDQDVDGLTEPSGNAPLGQIAGDRNLETFRFNPAYRVDLILFRNILSRVQGAYYIRPSLAYDFVREPAGQRLGGTIAAIWSRASEFIQAPGHDADLGIELNAAIYFQSKDGALNDHPGEMGGFYSRLEYGVLFPMAGLDYPRREAERLQDLLDRTGLPEVSSAQTLRLHLGVLF